MGATSFFQLPYPDPTSTVDVPRDVKALADKIETWKNGLNIPAGQLSVGTATDSNAYYLGCRKLDPPDVYEGRIYIQTGSDWAFVLLKNSVEISRFRLSTSGQMGTGTGATYRPLPFATELLANTISASAATSGSRVFNFTAGRFTDTPAIFATGYGGGSSSWGYTSNTNSSSSAQVTMRNMDNAAATATINVWVYAIQQTSTSTVGLSQPRVVLPPPDYPTLSTCHTKGCANEGIAIEGGADAPDVEIVCGPCGTIVDDVKTPKKGRRHA